MGSQRRGKGGQRKVTPVIRDKVKKDQVKKTWPIYPILSVISFFGFLDASFLVVEYLAGKTDVCSANGILDCSKVLGSDYSKLGSIPLSELGALAYFTVFSLSVLASYDYKFAKTYLPFVISAMFLTTVYLFYVQAVVLGAFCLFCLISAGITTLLTIIIWFAKIRRLA